MTYSINLTKRHKMMFSDSNFKWCRKRPTVSIYDAEQNTETKIASFNSQETFEWFISLFEGERRSE